MLSKFVPAAITLGLFGFLCVTPAFALSTADCSIKYKAAQAAGTVTGISLKDFRAAACGMDATMTSPLKAPDASATASAVTTAKPDTTTKPATTAKVDTTTKPAATAVNAEPTLATTENAPEPAAPTIAMPKGVVMPKSISSKYSSESAGKGRMHTCLDQYNVNKANNTLGGLKWVQKGGGYYSLCNQGLKS